MDLEPRATTAASRPPTSDLVASPMRTDDSSTRTAPRSSIMAPAGALGGLPPPAHPEAGSQRNASEPFRLNRLNSPSASKIMQSEFSGSSSLESVLILETRPSASGSP